MTMLLSEAWKDLNARQKTLYLYCKAQYYAEKTKPRNDPLCFTMNRSKWADLYGLYDRGNGKTFYTDLYALIAHGFIICVEDHKQSFKKNIYKFSSMWRFYGTADFEVLPSEKPPAMIDRELKELASKG